MEQINDMTFEEMKRQLSVLNAKLEKETLVNERIMRQTMKERYSKVGRSILITGWVCFLMVPYMLWYLPKIGASNALTIVTALFMLLAGVYTFYTHKGKLSESILHGDLIQVSKKLLYIKKKNRDWICYIGIPFIIIWLPWFIYEFVSVQTDVHFLRGGLIGIVIGFLVGGVFGTRKYRQEQRLIDDLLNDIKELTEEK